MQVNPNKATVIIPAHNEAHSITACLKALGSGKNQSFQIVVICNGCTDKTEEVIKNEFPQVCVFNLPQASKSLAIRFAESKNPGFPRVYMDADILFNEDLISEFIRNIEEQDEDFLTIPKSHALTKKSSVLVKKYYEAWYSTKYVKQFGFGSGVYALSESARSRFNEWPELIADDGFVRTQFGAKEIKVLNQVMVLVTAPKTLIQLIKIKARSKLGNLQLRDYLRHQTVLKKYENQEDHVVEIHSEKRSLAQYFSYFLVNSCALVYAKLLYRKGDFSWLRDESSRL